MPFKGILWTRILILTFLVLPANAVNTTFVETISEHPFTSFRTPSTAQILLSLTITVLAGIGGGRLSERWKQPALLGMLLTGIFLRNVFPTTIVAIPSSWTSKLWALALSSVLARAGLTVRRAVVTANIRATVLFGIVPVGVEALWLAGVSAWAFGLPPAWSFVLAFGVASISPGVVVPLLLGLMETPGWSTSRLPPLLLAATGVDVTVATTCFGVAVAAVFGHRHEKAGGGVVDFIHESWVTRGIEEISIGVLLGCLIGGFGYFLYNFTVRREIASNNDDLPSSKLVENKIVPAWVIYTLFITNFVTNGYIKTNGFPGAASSSVILSWCVITNTWDAESVEAANRRLKLIWKYAEPFLFPVIGASVSFAEINSQTLITAALVVLSSVAIRGVVSFCVALFGAGFKWKESVFVCGTWCGKASVQAALCHATYDYIHHYHLEGTVEEQYSRIVFACMLSAIIIGGPFAATWVSFFAKHTHTEIGDIEASDAEEPN
ncbi:hypothetical protein HK096_011280 [Nowakowskiella sp. JEL0078]|nr:hypothetical protein HK096_011280 [Nowakowskiella sp. JEL0078]